MDLHLYLYIKSSDQKKPDFKQEIINSGQIGLNMLIWPIGWQWQMLIAQLCLDSLRRHGLFVEFSRQEYWSGLSFPSPGYLPDPGIESGSPASQADCLPSKPPGKPNQGVGQVKLRIKMVNCRKMSWRESSWSSRNWGNMFIHPIRQHTMGKYFFMCRCTE